jgi:large subunit ribosomal protein L18
MNLVKKQILRQKRIWRARKKIKGTESRPRLCLSITNMHMYAQAIDDVNGKTVVCLTTMAKDSKESGIKANVVGAQLLGKLFGQKALAAGLESVVFDRHGKPYHGVVKAFAEAAREAGLKF